MGCGVGMGVDPEGSLIGTRKASAGVGGTREGHKNGYGLKYVYENITTNHYYVKMYINEKPQVHFCFTSLFTFHSSERD